VGSRGLTPPLAGAVRSPIRHGGTGYAPMTDVVWYSLLAAVGLALGALASKVILRYRICDAGFVTWGSGIAVGLAAVAVWPATSVRWPVAGVAPMLAVASAIVVASWLLGRAIHEGDISTVAPLMGIKIPITVALSAIVLGESHGVRVYVAVGLATAGAVMFGLGRQRAAQGGHGRHPIVPILYGCASALAYAVADQFARVALRHMDQTTLVLWACMLRGALSAVMILHPYYRQYKVHAVDVWVLLASGAAMVGGLLALYTAYRLADGVTIPNIVLASRGLFLLAVGYVLSKALRVPIERQPASVYVLRTAGALLLGLSVAMI